MTHPRFDDPAFWDAAAQYQSSVHPFTAAFAARAWEEAALPPGARVLDIACGTGALAFHAAEAGADVLATDFSPGMVARVAELGHPRIEARVLDGQALALPDAGFDAAFSIFGIILFADWRAGLAEMARVVRLGVLATWAHPHGAAVNKLLADLVSEFAPELVIPPLPATGLAALREPASVVAHMESAGFHDVRVTKYTHPFVTPVDQVLGNETLFAFSPVWPLLTPAQKGAVVGAMRDRAADGELRIPSTALIAVGHRA